MLRFPYPHEPKGSKSFFAEPNKLFEDELFKRFKRKLFREYDVRVKVSPSKHLNKK